MGTSLIHDHVVSALSSALAQAAEEGVLSVSPLPTPVVDLPKREEWGDLSSNIAMILAPKVRRPPLEVASELAARLTEQFPEVFDRVDVAPPGFLNFTIHKKQWLDVLKSIEAQGTAFGQCAAGQRQRVLVEFVSANPTGPLHVGHGRGAALGHALSNVLAAAGYDVHREFYINDAGRQLRLLGASVLARYQQQFDPSADFPEDGYHGTYVRDVAKALGDEPGVSLRDLEPHEAEQRAAEFAYQRLLANIQDDLTHFGIHFDLWFRESELVRQGRLEQTLRELKAEDLVFEQEDAWWFRSSRFGDDKDRVVVKHDGDSTYLASDIAYHRDKFERGFDQLVNIWGADHHGYVPRMEAAVQAFGYSRERLRTVLVQMVSLSRGGQKVEMSKRAGEFVTLREVVDEVGADAAKFFFLMRRSDTHLDFDLELAKQQSADNPVYYVQYAHARLASLFRVAEARGIVAPAIRDATQECITGPHDIRLIKQLSRYPGVVEGSAASLEPHRLTFYLQELAAGLHTYYNRHRILPPLGTDMDGEGATSVGEVGPDGMNGSDDVRDDPVVDLTPEVTGARLALMRQVQTVLYNGLTLLGVSSPDHM